MALVLPLLGAVLGWVIGGWLGAVAGLLLMLAVVGFVSTDATPSVATGAQHPRAAGKGHSIEARRFRFALTALRVAGHIFRSGQAQKSELTDLVQGYLDGLGLNELEAAHAARAYEEGKSSKLVLRDALSEVIRVSNGDRAWLQLFLEIQWSAALWAGGGTVGVERRILDRIGDEFGFAPAERSEIERKSLANYRGQLAAHGVSHSDSDRHSGSATAARRGQHFQLTLGGKTIRDPGPGAVRQAVSAVHEQDEEFAILDRGGGGLTYVQCHAGREGFQLEYRDGSFHHHYEFTGGRAPKGTVLRVFLGFLRGDGNWKQELPWSRMRL